MQPKRIALFFVLTVLLFGIQWGVQKYFFPPPPPVWKARQALNVAFGLHPESGVWDAGPGKAPPKDPPPEPVDFGMWDVYQLRKWAFAKAIKFEAKDFVTLGSDDGDSRFHLQIKLDSHGAGVRSVLLNKFKATDEQTGKPKNELLQLVPEHANLAVPSNLLYHFAGKDVNGGDPAARPVVTLGEVNWKASAKEDDTLEDGRHRETVTFTTELDGVEVSKIFSLVEKDYHVGLEVRVRKLVPEERKFRYQLTGSKGLPIEGRWYTSTFRNALIGTVDAKGYVYRDLQTSAQIGNWQGGSPVQRDAEHFIRYAGISDQYFASVIVVDKDQKNEKFLTRARPTLEIGLSKGKITSLTSDKLVLLRADNKSEEFDLDELPVAERLRLTPEMKVAVWHRTDPQYRLTHVGEGTEPRELATRVATEPDAYHPTWEDDITVRVATESIDLKDDEPVVHKYLLYNGPVKPRLLNYVQNEKDRAAAGDVDRYEELGLYTMIDYQSPGTMGRIASTIYWTDLVIKCTNIMHWVLNKIHWVIPSFGLSIICLTVLVRGMMFPISRKGAMTSLRMQELAPELKKLHERYKDDKQAAQVAQMELYRKHGVNPFGTCWFMFLQMPIFMGLYYALQESITFRLARFWPTWIDNLAAPDMLIEWGQSIPYISTPESYGGFVYLGPYLNLLPIIAVTLMILQQKMITPPPTDEQQEMQQKMMKYMMAFMGLMFYKVAAGLCMYFIASSLWGFAERKLLPKKKPLPADGTVPTPSTTLLSRVLGGGNGEGSSTAMQTEPLGRTKLRNRRNKERFTPTLPEEPTEGGTMLQRLSRWFRNKRDGLSDWWAELLKQAAKK